MKKLFGAPALLLLVLSLASVTQAVVVVPTYDTFGTLAGATFGGSGIPNDAVAISTIVDGSNTITLGLTAHQRFVGPNLPNDGAGTFTAPTGVSAGASLWNFAYYMDISGGGTFADYQFNVLYDFDKAVNTDSADLGNLDINAGIVALGGTPGSFTLVQDSQNLTFGFLGTASSFVTPPSATYDPNEVGQYSFALQVFDGSSTFLGESAIIVNAVPEPSAFLFGGLICSVIGGNYLRKRMANKAKS
ncbi:hypothetical protein [Bythopirellula polymerisocia]|uniref:PEP-CTERM protein-sorting domain-containing protein n=1 Tax=Bythopirellula polymerisocia TaxID=2528003 RepID=A0A5C6CMJ7_9BACT|nr:hypothetical protein [Bythopirellula polymerisocia]TWU25820.1 hypothetical protein Pla144_30320 [Bythopirellula polymerisocia]